MTELESESFKVTEGSRYQHSDATLFREGARWLASKLKHEDITFGDGSTSPCECMTCIKIRKLGL